MVYSMVVSYHLPRTLGRAHPPVVIRSLIALTAKSCVPRTQWADAFRFRRSASTPSG